MLQIVINRPNLGSVYVMTAADITTLTISPDMVRINDTKDADWLTAIWTMVRQQAARGRSVRITPYEITYSPAQVARMVGVSKMTVLRRIADGTIKATKKGAYWRIAESELDALSDSILTPMVEMIADELEFPAEAV